MIGEFVISASGMAFTPRPEAVSITL